MQAALPILPESDLVFAICADGYAAHFAKDYMAAFRPLLRLELNGKTAAEWSKRLASGVGLPSFYINSAKFTPRATETAVEQKEGPRYPSAVVKLEFTTAARTLDRLKLKPGASDAAVAGQKLALRDCLSCHAHTGFGGTNAGRPWLRLKTWSANTDYFRRYVWRPKSVPPAARMPGFADYDDTALDALTAYFREFRPEAVAQPALITRVGR